MELTWFDYLLFAVVIVVWIVTIVAVIRANKASRDAAKDLPTKAQVLKALGVDERPHLK